MKTKTLLFLIFAWSFLFFSCHKNDPAPIPPAPITPAPISVSPFEGTYKGSVIDTLYDSPWATDTSYVMKINSTTVAGQVTLTNSPIAADTAMISGTIFTMPKKNIIDGSFRYELFASGSFSGPNNDTLRAVFNSNSYKATNGTVGSVYKRTGFFVKQ